MPLMVELPVLGPFSLEASPRFLDGFAPAGTHASRGPTLALAFPVEGDRETAGALVSQRGDRVAATVQGDADPEAVRAQLRRLLSLNVDGRDFPIGGRAGLGHGRTAATPTWSAAGRLLVPI